MNDSNLNQNEKILSFRKRYQSLKKRMESDEMMKKNKTDCCVREKMLVQILRYRRIC